MTEEPTFSKLITREMQARDIMNRPEEYMLCEGCGSVLYIKMIGSCSVCHAYRFRYDLQGIREAAERLGQQEDTTLPYL